MPTLIEVMESRLGIEEIKGKDHNPAILQMWIDSGHPEIQTDEEFWCSAAMCSAALASAMPMPPVNINPMARSWLTWGVTVAHKDVARGDVVVWPRGKPGSSSGHVNCVAEVRKIGSIVQVRCVGGNQSHPSGGAITLTDWTNIAGALPNGVRRPVPATVKDLRAAGSTTIKSNDNMEKVAIATTFFTPIVEGVKSLFEGAPNLSSVQGLTYWEAIGKVAGNVFAYANAHPYMVAICIVGGGLWLNSHLNKRARVAEHAAGLPIAGEVAKLQGA